MANDDDDSACAVLNEILGHRKQMSEKVNAKGQSFFIATCGVYEMARTLAYFGAKSARAQPRVEVERCKVNTGGQRDSP